MSLFTNAMQIINSWKLRLNKIRYDWYVLISLMFLSILGVAITDASDLLSHWYWIGMVPVFFSACLYVEWNASRESGVNVYSIIIKQIQHWLGLLAAIYLTFFLQNIGSLNNEITGLFLLLIIALTTFLAGVTMGWLFRLLGIFLGLSLYFVAYMEHFIWLVICLSILVLLAYYYLTKQLEHDSNS